MWTSVNNVALYPIFEGARSELVPTPGKGYRTLVTTDPGQDEELAAIASAARAWLVWEWEIGGGLVPATPAGEGRPEGSPLTAAPPARTARDEVPAAPRTPPATAPGADRLRVLADEASACTRCELHRNRTRSVFARGSAEAEVAFVGEGPGYHEDQQGSPFVGKAGQLLDRMIAAMGYDRDAVYICNVVKCRPPENRTPLPPEAEACAPYLRGQLSVVAPKVIVALGKCAATNLGCAGEAGPWRGRWGTFEGIPVMPTYHPAFLLRSPHMKRPVWEDLQAVIGRLGRTPPPRDGR